MVSLWSWYDSLGSVVVFCSSAIRINIICSLRTEYVARKVSNSAR